MIRIRNDERFNISDVFSAYNFIHAITTVSFLENDLIGSDERFDILDAFLALYFIYARVMHGGKGGIFYDNYCCIYCLLTVPAINWLAIRSLDCTTIL